MEELKKCDHCYEVIDKEYILDIDGEARSFCCNGCLSVYQILNNNNLCDYYYLKEQLPGDNRPIYSSESYAYLDSIEFAEKYTTSLFDGNEKSFAFFIEGVHCAACLWLLEKLPTLCSDVSTSKLNMSNSMLEITYRHDAQLSSIAKKITTLGYRPHPILQDADLDYYSKKEDRRWLIRIGIAFAAAGNIMLYSLANYAGAEGFYKNYFNLFSFICIIPVVTYCAIPFYESAWGALKTKSLSIDIPIVLALITGTSMGIYSLLTGADYFYFDTLSTLVFLLLLTRFALKKIQQKTLSAHDLSSFFINKYAKKINSDGEEEEVLTKFLEVGDKVKVEANEVIPIDGRIIKGSSYINNSLLTGEVKPQNVSVGEDIYMGAKNLDSELFVEVSAAIDNSRLGRILKEIESGRHAETKISILADKLARRFISFVFILGTFFFIYFYFTIGLEVAITRTLTLLVVTCPCALALTTPLALILGLSYMARMGVFVKNEFIIEKLADAKNIFLDKTGTLTHGNFSVINFEVLDEQQVLPQLIYSLEKRSHHPIARSIVEYFEDLGINSELEIYQYKETPGIGVSCAYDNASYEIRAIKNTDVDERKKMASRVGVFKDHILIATFQLADSLREKVPETISQFKAEGVEPFILSGDNRDSVLEVTNQLPIETSNIYFEQTPEQKRDIVKAKKQSIMVGDGVNDAIAFKAAYVGVAVEGSADISLRAADVYLSKRGVSYVLNLIRASKFLIRIIYINLGFSFIYNLLGIYLTFTGQISPLIAAILMPLSSITVLLSTLFLTRKIKKLLQ